MNKYHLEIVRKSSKHCSVGFEVDVSNSNGAITQKTKFSLHVQLLQKDKAMASCVHCGSEKKDNIYIYIYIHIYIYIFFLFTKLAIVYTNLQRTRRPKSKWNYSIVFNTVNLTLNLANIKYPIMITDINRTETVNTCLFKILVRKWLAVGAKDVKEEVCPFLSMWPQCF